MVLPHLTVDLCEKENPKKKTTNNFGGIKKVGGDWRSPLLLFVFLFLCTFLFVCETAWTRDPRIGQFHLQNFNNEFFQSRIEGFEKEQNLNMN